MPKRFKSLNFLYSSIGFTLIELMVTIAIIAILTVVGVTLFTKAQSNARDSVKRLDIESIAKAYENKFNNQTSKYNPLAGTDFSTGAIPKTPENIDYFNVIATDGSGFKACAALAAHPNQSCNSSSSTCVCQESVQSTLNTSSGIDNGNSTGEELGYGGGTLTHPTSCDPNGTLDDGLVGYWKMDEGSGVTTADSSGQGNNGTIYGSPAWITGKFGSGMLFSITGVSIPHNYIDIPGSGSIENVTDSRHSFVAWVYPYGNPPSGGTNTIATALGRPGYHTQIGMTSGGSSRITSYKVPATTPPPFTAMAINGAVTSLSQWSLIIGTVDTGSRTVKLYLNGSPTGTPVTYSVGETLKDYGTVSYLIGSSKTGTMACTGDPPTAGDYVYCFNGIIDDARLYNRALTDPEISALFGTPPGSGCIPP